MLTTPARYRMRVQGQLGPQWADWFVGFTLSWEVPGQTVLVGQVVDQAALYGLLNTLRDLGLPLLEVVRLPPEESRATDP
jgi:hypothetical protein